MKRYFLFFIIAGNFSAANAQTGNVGIGTATPGSKLTVNGSFGAPYAVVSASGNVGANDYYLSYNGSTNGTLTLPAAAAGSGNFLGRMYHFKNTGTATLTIAANGIELIDNQSGAGVASISVPAGFYAYLISKGTTTGITWELALLSSANSVPTAASTYPFSATATSTRQTCTATTSTFITTEFVYPQGTVINTNNVLNTTTGRFTAPSSGFYQFYGTTQFDNSQISGQPLFGIMVLYLLKNGTVQIAQSFVQSSVLLLGVNVSSIVFLNAGETVSLGGVASVTSGGVYQVVGTMLYGYKIAN